MSGTRTARMPRVFIFGAQISDANFILRQHQVQYISGTVPTGAAKYKHGIGNIGPEYKYSAATRSGLLGTALQESGPSEMR